MSILLIFADLRYDRSEFKKFVIEFESIITALDILGRGLGELEAKNISNDLQDDNRSLTISWYNAETDAISEIGGVGRLDWVVPNNTILTVTYEGDQITDQRSSEFENWSIENTKDFLSQVSPKLE